MKTEGEREEIIKAISVLLQAYDSTLDEVLALLHKIDDEEDEEDIKDYDEAKKDIEMNGTVSWDEYKRKTA